MHSRGLNKTLRLILLGLLSFFIPFLIMTLIYYSCGMAPWGEKSVLIMDMSDQYVAFFFRAAQHSGGREQHILLLA